MLKRPVYDFESISFLTLVLPWLGWLQKDALQNHTRDIEELDTEAKALRDEYREALEALKAAGKKVQSRKREEAKAASTQQVCPSFPQHVLQASKRCVPQHTYNVGTSSKSNNRSSLLN